jgi:hypothetical protein
VNAVRFAEYLRPVPTPFWITLRQIGVECVVSVRGQRAIDLPWAEGALRLFGRQGHIAFGHSRDVRGTRERFVETFHDEGQTDMYTCLKARHEIGFEGVLRPDHVPTREGDLKDNPAYSNLARLHALGDMTGLREAVIAALTR